MGKILLWNLGLMFGFMVLTSLSGQSESIFYDMGFMTLQMIANFGLGLYFLIRQKRIPGLAHLLSAFLVILVGFGMCAGKIMIMGG